MTDSIAFLPQGAIVQSFRFGSQDIVLGFPEAGDYAANSAYFGETIGRVANRIKGGEVELNGKICILNTGAPGGSGEHCLHGGVEGWGKRVFEGPKYMLKNGKESVLFEYRSVDGEEGFPGAVDVEVLYRTSGSKEAGKEEMELEIEYQVKMAPDEEQPEGVQETVVNVTNHTYDLLCYPQTQY
jgi:aldose 1-epimerase